MVQANPLVISTGPGLENPGPLTRTVLDFVQTQKRLLPTAKSPADWAPLTQFVAVDQFQRIGCFLEEQNWPQFLGMLTQWASGTGKFETIVRKIVELPGVVYYEITERHFSGDVITVVNSLTVFEFNEAGKIRQLRVYLQQPAAR
jgi:hypothetical protein